MGDCPEGDAAKLFLISSLDNLISSILTFVLGECIRNPKLDKLNKAFFYISHINLFLTMFLIIWEEEAFFKNFIYLIIMTV